MKPASPSTKARLIPISISHASKITDSKLIVRERSNIHFIPKNQIEYCKSDSNYTTIYLRSGRRLMTAKCLKHIASDLSNPNFQRIHSKYLINIEHLEKIDTSDKKAFMQGGQILPISRSRYKDIIAFID